jgi:hypothetical protein
MNPVGRLSGDNASLRSSPASGRPKLGRSQPSRIEDVDERDLFAAQVSSGGLAHEGRPPFAAGCSPPGFGRAWRSAAVSTSRDGRASRRFTGSWSRTSTSCCESGPHASSGSTLLWAEWLREDVLMPVAHRHVVLTIPRLLRPLFRRRRELLGELARAGAEAVKELVRHASREGDAQPGIVVFWLVSQECD